jgi:hypothetical protein
MLDFVILHEEQKSVKLFAFSCILKFRSTKHLDYAKFCIFAEFKKKNKILFPATYLRPDHQATPYGKCSAPSSYQGQSHEIRAARQAMQASPLGSSSRTANEPPARKENYVKK